MKASSSKESVPWHLSSVNLNTAISLFSTAILHASGKTLENSSEVIFAHSPALSMENAFFLTCTGLSLVDFVSSHTDSAASERAAAARMSESVSKPDSMAILSHSEKSAIPFDMRTYGFSLIFSTESSPMPYRVLICSCVRPSLRAARPSLKKSSLSVTVSQKDIAFSLDRFFTLSETFSGSFRRTSRTSSPNASTSATASIFPAPVRLSARKDATNTAPLSPVSACLIDESFT